MAFRVRPSLAASLALSVPFFLASFAATGCKKNEPAAHEGAPPPEPGPAAPADACAAPGSVDDVVSAAFFPRTVPGACLEPKGDTRTFGERGKSTLEELCTTAFDGECEVYRGYGVKRVVGVRYVEGGGKQGTVEVYVNQFATKGGALAMFTKRVVGDSDPADPAAPRAFGAGERSALGTGRGYVWSGDYLVEMTYTNDDGSLTQEAFKTAADAVLAPIGKAIGAALPGNASGVPSLAALPVGSQIAGGVAYFPTDGFGIPHLGPVAVGYYRDGDTRFRMFAIAHSDANEAKAEMRLFKTRPKAKPEAGFGEEAVAVELEGGAERGGTPYVIARVGATVVGVGAEPFSPEKTLDDAGRKARIKVVLTALAGR
jgi:hypothetical protein